MSNLELFHQVHGARVLLFKEQTTWIELVQTAGSGKEYRVSATPNHCHHPFGKNGSTLLCFPFDSKGCFIFLCLKLSLIHADK